MSINRRQFIKASTTFAAALAGSAASGNSAGSRKLPAEKLNVAVIGITGRGGDNLNGVASQNIVAICDIDDNNLAIVGKRFPAAAQFNDFRKMLERKDIEAVVVSTPDHVHASAALWAMRLGKHVYCEKPLAHSVWEVRQMIDTAKKHKLVTQMGTQIHAGDNYRRVVELVQSGAIGPVKEVHVWADGGFEAHGRPPETPETPKNIHWDLWLGPAMERPYHPNYVPFYWRRYLAFGGGTFADLACHHMDLPYWALKLKYPTSVEAEGPAVDDEGAPAWTIARYKYPAREELPAVDLTWYHGGRRPKYFDEGRLTKWGNGTLFVGQKGMLLADYDRHILLPESDFKDFSPPAQTIQKSIGHHEEWIQAIKTGSPTTCNFGYSGPLAESVQLGVAAYRTGRKLDYDSKHLKAKGCPEADRFIKPEFRPGWGI